MNLHPIQKINVVEQVFDQMQGLLIEGAWHPGDRLPSENDLASTFGVSRMTVRQAMQKLKALGLIETRSGSGSFVRELSPGDSLNELIPVLYIGDPSQIHIFQFREMIDSESVRIATPLADDACLQKLEDTLFKMMAASEADDRRAFSKYDLKFHTTIVKQTGNPMMIRAYEILLNILKESMLSVIEKMKFTPALDYHGRILKAIKNNDPSKAAELMRDHIRQNYPYFE